MSPVTAVSFLCGVPSTPVWPSNRRRRCAAALLFAIVVWTSGCGGSGPEPTTSPVFATSHSAVTVSSSFVATESASEPMATPAGLSPSCTPRSCAELNFNCGKINDGCGHLLDCGLCSSGQFCGGGGVHVCGTGPGRCGDGVTNFPNELCDSTLCCPVDCQTWGGGPRPVCRPKNPSLGCDVAELCSEHFDCPKDQPAPKDDKTPCRPPASGKLCDAPEYCDGTSFDCPIDKAVPKDDKTPCRPPAPGKLCDAPEFCNGSSFDCPIDKPVPGPKTDKWGGRAVVMGEACDEPKQCSVQSSEDAEIPGVPLEVASRTVCRPAAPGKLCDAPEYCDGKSFDCPIDGPIQYPIPRIGKKLCRAAAPAKPCDAPEYCDGKTFDCPLDAYYTKADEHVCREAAAEDACDAPELCDGAGFSCPPEPPKPIWQESALRPDVFGNDMAEPGENFALDGRMLLLDSAGRADPSWVIQGRLTALFSSPTPDYFGVVADQSTLQFVAGEYSCMPAGDCYVSRSVVPTLPRTPNVHWDIAYSEELQGLRDGAVLDSCYSTTRTVHIGGSFTDVPALHRYYFDIERALHNRLTVGCGTGQYCPSKQGLRGELAAMITNYLKPSGPPSEGVIADRRYNCTTGPVLFDDPEAQPLKDFCPHIHYVVAQGIAQGCASRTPYPFTFCAYKPAERRELLQWAAEALRRRMPPGTSIPTMGPGYNCVAGGTSLIPGLPPNGAVCPHAHWLLSKGLLPLDPVMTQCTSGVCQAETFKREVAAHLLSTIFSLTLGS